MQAKLDRKMDIDEVERLVSAEAKVVMNEQSNLKEDMNRIETKIDKLLDKITRVFIG